MTKTILIWSTYSEHPLKNVKNSKLRRISERPLLITSQKLLEKKKTNYKLERAMRLNFLKENFYRTSHLLVKEILKRLTLLDT